jgi:hypothetical protein
MLVIPTFKKWVVIYPERLTKGTEDFVSHLIRAAQGMRFSIPEPQ